MSNMNFNLFGQCMAFNLKLIKHREAGNCEKTKDYICAAFDTFNPVEYKNHPCWEQIHESIEFLKSQGWKVRYMDWKDQGKQIVCVSPNEIYYRSKYNHSQMIDKNDI